MQAGQTKADRKASRVARAKARPDQKCLRLASQIADRMETKQRAIKNEDRKRIAATPTAISATKEAYKHQCEELKSLKSSRYWRSHVSNSSNGTPDQRRP
jgi:hypothetical protein